MGKLLGNRGLQVIAGRASNTADAFLEIDSMSIDDSTVAFTATDTALDDGGAVANEADANFDSAPTRSAQTVTHVATFGTAVFVGSTVKRIALHNAAAASVTSASDTWVGGVDGQSLVKSADYSLVLTLKITYTSL